MLGSIKSAVDSSGNSYETIALRTLNAFAVDVMNIPSQEDLFWYVAKNVVGRLKFIDCVIYKANAEQTELVQVAAMGEKNPFGRSIINPLKIPFGQGITGRVAQNRKAIIIDDLRQDKHYIADTQEARSEICLPMVFGNRIVGVIDCEHPEPFAFGPTELEILTTVAAMTSAKLELLAEAERSNLRYRDLVQSHADLTEEVNNRKSLQAQLYEAREMETIGRLAGDFAKNFDNLLTTISNNLKLLEEAVEDEKANSPLTSAQNATANAAKLVDDMLVFAQRSHLCPEMVDLDSLIGQVSQTAQLIFSERTEIHLALSQNSWPVKVDPSATKSTLLNLMINAHQAMEHGGKLRISTENIWFSVMDINQLSLDLAPGNYVCVSFQDTGSGIPLNRRQKVFDPFYSTKSNSVGGGLGLSAALGFMKQSGGTVSVGNSTGPGTTFKLYFPASAASLAAVK